MFKKFDCGIYLGINNACIAVPDERDGYKIIEDKSDRMLVTPMAVCINGKGRVLVGQRAYNSQIVEDVAKHFVRTIGSNKFYHFFSSNVDKSSEELVSEVIRKKKEDVEQEQNRIINNAVITVPATFKTLQSESIVKAGKLAGFKNIILLQEPIAASIAYGAKTDSKDKHWMVFDYGGSTLDVAIISTTNNRLTVENSEGDNYFGGNDIDHLIYSKIFREKLVAEGYKVDALLDETTNKALVRKIMFDCERCKIELSNKTSAFLELFDINDDNGEPIEFECEISRTELESLISETVEKSIEIAKKAMEGANIQASQLDKILLVGGSTFIPLVRQRLTEVFKVELESSLNPMTVVAAGAAIYASTSVIDTEENVEITDASHAIINLTYDPISSDDKVDVIGMVANIADVSIVKIKIDRSSVENFSGVDWTSGWVELLDTENGIFDIDVILEVGKLNHFKVSACDAKGTAITIENSLFDIKHNENVLKMSAPPATMSIGVQIQDPKTGNDILYPLIHKNTPLPACVEYTYKLERDLNPEVPDVIVLHLWEGENIINPHANRSAGEITIKSTTLSETLPAGTEIDITIVADENRNIRVSGFIPDIDYELPEETLRAEAKVDLSESVKRVDDRIKQSEVSLQRLKNQGVDVSDLEDELEQVKAAYDDTYDMIDTDDQIVCAYIDLFNDLETRIIIEERKYFEKETSANRDNKIQKSYEMMMSTTTKYKSYILELKQAYCSAKTDEEKSFIAEKVDTLVKQYEKEQAERKTIAECRQIVISNGNQLDMKMFLQMEDSYEHSTDEQAAKFALDGIAYIVAKLKE